MIIVLTGAPGAGKGTQADLVVGKDSRFVKISTGDALRNQVKIGSKIGVEAEAYMKDGRLVPDDVLVGILRAELEANSEKFVLLDGYPRNINQAETLRGFGDGSAVLGCVHLDVSPEILVERLSGRRVCSGCGASFHLKFSPSQEAGVCDKCHGSLVQRTDDGIEKVKTRLQVFENETKPIIAFYKGEDKYHVVDGSQSSKVVHESLMKVLSQLVSS